MKKKEQTWITHAQKEEKRRTDRLDCTTYRHLLGFNGSPRGA